MNEIRLKLVLALAAVSYVGLFSFVGMLGGLCFDIAISSIANLAFQPSTAIITGIVCGIFAIADLSLGEWKVNLVKKL